MTIPADRQPTPENIRKARLNQKMSETAAADVIYVSRESWRKYEKGTTDMKLGLWELFLFKTGQIWLRPIADPKPKSKSRGRIQNLRPFKAQSAGVE